MNHTATSVSSTAQMNTKQGNTWLIALSGLICLIIFTLTIPLPRIDGHLIGSDGLSYYAILRSGFFDKDFDYTNDYKILGEEYIIFSYTDQGLPTNPFAMGSAILWFPFFLIAHGISLILFSAGIPVPLNGTGYIYEAAVCYGTIIYASVGFFLTYKLAARILSVQNALIATLCIWWSSQAIYYILAEPSMSHGISIFTVALFLWWWYAPTPQRTLREWLILGGITGLVALGRWQDGIIAIVPVAELGWWVITRSMSLRQAVLRGLLFIISATIIFSPQFLMWKAIYGSYLTIPQGNDFITWNNPHILETLFSTRHGLFSWHPILLIALFGLIGLWKNAPRLAIVGIFIVLCQIYINSAVGRWWADDAFGGRRFISSAPVFIIMLTALLHTVSLRQKRYLYICCIVLFIWNGLSFAQYRLGFVSKNEALTIQEMTVDRLLLPWQLVKRIAE